jgi:hypothetical protein
MNSFFSALFVIVAILVMPWSSALAVTTTTCTYDRNVVYFFNGIRTDYQGTIANREHIRAELSKIWTESAVKQTEFRHFFNDSASTGASSFLEDVLDPVELALALNERDRFKTNAAMYLGTSTEEPSPELVSVFEKFIAGNLNAILDQYRSLDESEIARRSDFSLEITRVKNDLSDGKNVVLVGYSQGSVFANLFYEIISRSLSKAERNRFSIIAIGSPDSSVPNGHYANHFEDNVLKAFRETYGTRRKYLEPNYSSPLVECKKILCNIDFLRHHMFSEAYMLEGSEGWGKATSFLLSSLVTSKEGEGFIPILRNASGKNPVSVEDAAITVYATGLSSLQSKDVIHLRPGPDDGHFPETLEKLLTAGRFQTLSEPPTKRKESQATINTNTYDARYLSCRNLKSLSKHVIGTHKFRVDMRHLEGVRIVIAVPKNRNMCQTTALSGWEMNCSEKANYYFWSRKFYQQDHKGGFSSIQIPITVSDKGGALEVSFSGGYTWYLSERFAH